MFFELELGMQANSAVYRGQILKGTLMEFWEKPFGNVQEPIVMEDNAAVHKKVCIRIRHELGINTSKFP